MNTAKEWSKRLIAYHERLDEFFDDLPIAMKTFIDDVPNKNAEVLCYSKQNKNNFQLTMRAENGFTFLLNYTLKETPYKKKYLSQRHDTETKMLHDEVFRSNDKTFIHFMWLSNGMILVIPFTNFKIKRLNVQIIQVSKNTTPTVEPRNHFR